MQIIDSIVNFLPSKQYRKILALRELVSQLPDPIIVWNMGKVGSSTVCETLSNNGINNLHIHCISEKVCEQKKKIYRKGAKKIPPYIYLGEILKKGMKYTQSRVEIITLVRDPIARRISNYFQAGQMRGINTSNSIEAVRQIKSRLHSQDSLTYEYNYFDNEIKRITGVDIMNHSFDRVNGFGIIDKYRWSILVLKLENLDELVSTIMSQFVGQKLNASKSNVEKSNTYEKIKKEFFLEKGILRRIYDHKWMRHFYTQEQINQFIDRWSK